MAFADGMDDDNYEWYFSDWGEDFRDEIPDDMTTEEVNQMSSAIRRLVEQVKKESSVKKVVAKQFDYDDDYVDVVIIVGRKESYYCIDRASYEITKIEGE